MTKRTEKPVRFFTVQARCKRAHGNRAGRMGNQSVKFSDMCGEFDSFQFPPPGASSMHRRGLQTGLMKNFIRPNVYSIALSSGKDACMISRFSVLSVTAARARTILPASTECVSHTLPPMTQSFPMRVSPPRIVAPA